MGRRPRRGSPAGSREHAPGRVGVREDTQDDVCGGSVDHERRDQRADGAEADRLQRVVEPRADRHDQQGERGEGHAGRGAAVAPSGCARPRRGQSPRSAPGPPRRRTTRRPRGRGVRVPASRFGRLDGLPLGGRSEAASPFPAPSARMGRSRMLAAAANMRAAGTIQKNRRYVTPPGSSPPPVERSRSPAATTERRIGSRWMALSNASAARRRSSSTRPSGRPGGLRLGGWRRLIFTGFARRSHRHGAVVAHRRADTIGGLRAHHRLTNALYGGRVRGPPLLSYFVSPSRCRARSGTRTVPMTGRKSRKSSQTASLTPEALLRKTSTMTKNRIIQYVTMKKITSSDHKEVDEAEPRNEHQGTSFRFPSRPTWPRFHRSLSHRSTAGSRPLAACVSGRCGSRRGRLGL